MRTVRTKVYFIHELTPEAKKVAIDSLRTTNVNYNWWDDMYRDAKEIGLKITSFDVYPKSANGEFLLAANEVAANILKNHGESCETWKTANSFMDEWQPVFNSYMYETDTNYEGKDYEDILQELENRLLNNLLSDYATMLEDEYDYLQGDDSVLETIEANMYEFTKDGKIF